MKKFYICVILVAHYDKPEDSESGVRIVLDMDSYYEAIQASSADEAVEIAEERASYNKQYFEPLLIKAIEVHNSISEHFKDNLLKKYSDIQNGEKYRLLSEDTFVKGKESWFPDGLGDWDVILK